MNDQQNQIQWFPGHMAKTRRLISENLKLVDAVAEITDARIPMSSRNPEIDTIVGSKPKIILLNKADYADSRATSEWIDFYKNKGIHAIAVDCRSGNGLKNFTPLCKKILSKKIEANAARGMSGKTIKIMVVGIPNVGKSSFINRMYGGKKAKVEDRPGVTRSNQWFSVGNGVELLDTPGVLWPKFDSAEVGEKLAFVGSVKDTIIDMETLAIRILKMLSDNYSEMLCARYKLNDITGLSAEELLYAIGKKRGMLISGGEVDYERASVMLLDEFRGAKIGRITLEHPEEYI